MYASASGEFGEPAIRDPARDRVPAVPLHEERLEHVDRGFVLAEARDRPPDIEIHDRVDVFVVEHGRQDRRVPP